MRDEFYMKRALKLAEKGCGRVSPNPVVGAVIVKDGIIIGEGYHERYGEKHAERNALSACTDSAGGAELFVTLEPCCHCGKQPPCTEAIIESGIRRVVIGSHDPNPLVAGKGIELLRQNGIEVVQGVLRERCDAINEIFFHYITEKRPFAALKYAMTLDGKLATFTGASRWITGDKARQDVQRLRRRFSAILVGVGTVLADNPSLTCRIDKGCDPVRIICDTSLKTPLDAAVVKTAGITKTIIATCCENAVRQAPYITAGCQIYTLPKKDGHVSLDELFERLGKEGIDSVLCEGGAEIAFSLLKNQLADKIYAYIAPKLFGGEVAKTPVGGHGVALPDEAFGISITRIHKIAEDILIEGRVNKNVHRNS